MEIFPATAVTTVTGQITDVLSDNIAVVVGLLAFSVAVNFAFRKVGKAVHGRL